MLIGQEKGKDQEREKIIRSDGGIGEEGERSWEARRSDVAQTPPTIQHRTVDGG
jgi:hypothetical protein